jgi:hypothetical protein
MYAGQRKRSNDIAKALKKEKSSSKSNEKKALIKKIHYYNKFNKTKDNGNTI